MTFLDTDQISASISLIHHQDKEQRVVGMSDLVKIGKPALPALKKLLTDPDWRVRYRGAEALGLINEEETLSDLISICTDPRDHVRYMAAKSLGLMGSVQALPALTSLLTDEHSYTRGIAAEGIAKISGPESYPILREALSREADSGVRDRIYTCLKEKKRENI
ncbi:MAG TPA: HEAT repeat domain-containing protein [Methanospirillum sp.]|nr:HEAT repeat domain-containing protein [Methanospirillum sp.]